MDISETPQLKEVYSRQLTFFAFIFYILFTNYEQRSWHVEINHHYKIEIHLKDNTNLVHVEG